MLLHLLISSNFYAGSFEFDGSGDYLVVTNTSDLVFEEDTFTIECWMYAQTYEFYYISNCN